MAFIKHNPTTVCIKHNPNTKMLKNIYKLREFTTKITGVYLKLDWH